jgi:hypothetical protein
MSAPEADPDAVDPVGVRLLGRPTGAVDPKRPQEVDVGFRPTKPSSMIVERIHPHTLIVAGGINPDFRFYQLRTLDPGDKP